MKEKEIIDDMRRITMLTGKISSVHEQNLQKWPYVVFDGVGEVEIDYNISKTITQEVGEGFVTFNLIIDKEHTDPLMLETRCKGLAKWVRYMFWKEIAVTVFFNNIRVFSDSTIKTPQKGKFGCNNTRLAAKEEREEDGSSKTRK